MFDYHNPARRLISTPFEVESDLNQTIQAADWVAAILGHIWSYELEPTQYRNYQEYKKYFWERINAASSHSTILRKKKISSFIEVESGAASTMQIAFNVAMERSKQNKN